MAAAQRRGSQDYRQGWSSWKSAVVAPELGGCMVAVVVRSLEAADTAAVAAAAEVDSSGMEEVQGEAAGSAAGLPAGDPVAGVDLAGRTATRAAGEAEQTEDMAAAAAAAAEAEEAQEGEAGNAAPSGEVALGDIALVVAEVEEAQEGEAGNTAPPELDSGAPRSWTWLLQLLMPYSILQRQFDEAIVESLPFQLRLYVCPSQR
ncbi:hypothetical protein J3F84DRAFT_380811 [Trichoderma pleuroticola]